MLSEIRTLCEKKAILPMTAAMLAWLSLNAQTAPKPVGRPGEAQAATLHWETAARLRRDGLFRSAHGTLIFTPNGVEFRAGKHTSQHWRFEEIRTAFLAPHRLVLKTYLNRSLHRPGDREYKFALTQPLPPDVAASVADAIGRPSRNADPDPGLAAIAVVPVRHRTLTSGTNGVLRFCRGGMEYVTAARDDSRSWRWADLQTLSSPDRYHLLVFGFRDTYTFDLKEPLSYKLVDWASDQVFREDEPAGGPDIGVASGAAAGDRHE